MEKFQYRVVGGEFTDATFRYLTGNPETYGPFPTYKKAVDVWRGRAQAKIDNCQHKLYVVREEIFERANAATITYWGDDFARNGQAYQVIDERPRQYCVRDNDGSKIWLPKTSCEIITGKTIHTSEKTQTGQS